MAFRVIGRHVLAQVADMDPEFRRVFEETLALLVDDPYNDPPRNAISVLPYRDPEVKNAFTVALGGHGLLLYQIKRDHPVIELLALVSTQDA